MRIQVLSDLHVEFLSERDRTTFTAEYVGADVLVLAGDIGVGRMGIDWAADQAARLKIPVIYVAGNHEFYGHDMDDCKRLMRQAASQGGVHLLENEQVVIGGVRFLGATLWTDYKASDDPWATTIIERRLSDHHVITSKGAKFLPDDALALHNESVAWLQRQLDTPFQGKTVVVTHHGPTPVAQHPEFPIDALSGAFWSDLESLVSKSDLWIYGHTHACLDQVVAGTRVVSNQAGYRARPTLPPEDPRFDPAFMVDL